MKRREVLRMNNRGQFYLLAAVIIITGMVGIVTITNTATKSTTDSSEIVFEISQELRSETAKVVDYGIYNNAYTDSLAEAWTEEYTGYTKDKAEITEWLFVYGNRSGMKLINYTRHNSGTISTNLGNSRVSTKTKPVLVKGKRGITVTELTQEIRVKDPLGIERKFKLQPGENFYFVLAKVSEDVYIETNSDDLENDN